MTAPPHSVDVEWNNYTWSCGSEAWRKIDGSDDFFARLWTGFFDDWWGQAGRTRLEEAKRERVLQFDPEYSDFNYPLNHTGGRIYLRDDILRSYDRAKAAYDAGLAGSGIALLGSANTGKTAALWYILVCCMAGEKLVLFNIRGKTILVAGNGVWRWQGQVLSGGDLPYYRRNTNTQRPWVLLRSFQHNDGQFAQLASTPVAFPIVAASPGDVAYKHLVKKMYGIVHILNPWSVEEAVQCVDWQFRPEQNIDPPTRAAVLDVIPYSGTAPYDIARLIKDSTQLEQRRYGQYYWMDQKRMEDVLLGSRVHEWSHPSPAQDLVSLYRVPSAFSSPRSSDVVYMDFALSSSEPVLRAEMGALSYEDARRLFRYSWSPPHLSALSGWFFQWLGVRSVCGDSLIESSRLEAKVSMMHMQSLPEHGPVFCDTTLVGALSPWTYCASMTGTTLIDGSASGLRIEQAAKAWHECESPMKRKKRAISMCKSLYTIAPNEYEYYVPMGDACNTLFDAVFFDTTARSVIVWLVHCVRPRRMGGDGCTAVRILRDAAAAGGRAVTLRYVLVCAYDEYEQQRSPALWMLPDDFVTGDLAGEVFVQYLKK